MDFKRICNTVKRINWQGLKFSYNGFSLVDVSSSDPDLSYTNVYMHFDEIKQELSESNEYYPVHNEELMNIKTGILQASPQLFESALSTYKYFDGEMRIRDLNDSETLIYSMACVSIKKAFPDFDPDNIDNYYRDEDLPF